MRYHHEPGDICPKHAQTYKCDHILYNACSLYFRNGMGLAVIQERHNSKLKINWWGPIDPDLIEEIYNAPGFDEYFMKNAMRMDNHGLYPTVKVRKIMWALRLRPLKKEEWESQ